jgi:hypothetical protein
LAIFGLVSALLLSLAGVAEASTGTSAPTSSQYPIQAVNAARFEPPGFSIDLSQAVALAKATREMQALHAHEHPLQIKPALWVFSPRHWYIQFAFHGKTVAEVDVSASGRVEGVWTGPEAVAPWAHGNYSPDFDLWWVVVPFALLFILPFIDIRRLWRLALLDGAVAGSFLLSYAWFEHGHLETAVWFVYPPLIYLGLRMLWIGVRGGGGTGAVAPLLPYRLLTAGLLLLVGARVALALVSPQLVDVGFASSVGAHRIALGKPLYYADPSHGDTYGPIAYLAYLPFGLAIGWKAHAVYLTMAKAATIVFDLVTILGLVLLGRRLRPGWEGRRLGLVLGWVWAACPLTLLGMIMHTNDGLIAMLSVLSLLLFASPMARGVTLGLATAAKFSPAALVPLYAARNERGVKGSMICLASFAVVVIIAIGLFLPKGGVPEFYHRTIGYQLTRGDIFSPWALYPGLKPLQMVLEGLAVLLAAAVGLIPRRRSLPQVCALAAAVTIAVQLPATHWFYYYVVWFMPFVLVALLGRQPAPAEATVTVPQAAVSSPAYVPGQPIGVEA